MDKIESENVDAHKEIIALIQPIREKLFNGMNETLKKIEDTLPTLMTKELHKALEDDRVAASRVLGQKKDRWLKAGLGIVPVVTAIVVWLMGRL